MGLEGLKDNVVLGVTDVKDGGEVMVGGLVGRDGKRVANDYLILAGVGGKIERTNFDVGKFYIASVRRILIIVG